MNPEFTQRPFAVGSLTGIRSFRVTADGVLTGCVHQDPWTPGLNEAKCRSIGRAFADATAAMAGLGPSVAMMSWALIDMDAKLNGRVNLRKRPNPKAAPKPQHEVAQMQCTCGFYAYYDNRGNPHHYPGNVLGIIEGFGVCTVGSRGFRCSKARIRALVIDLGERGVSSLNYSSVAHWGLIRRQYPGVPIFPTVEAALAEFPLTPAEVPEPYAEPLKFRLTISTAPTFGRSWFPRLRVARPWPKPAPVETPQERALRLRRERNTGPADQRGLDGRRRRTA